MTSLIKIKSQEIKAEIIQPSPFSYRLSIVLETVADYDDGRERTDSQEILTMGRHFSSPEDAEKFVKKDRVFRSAFKAALRNFKNKQS